MNVIVKESLKYSLRSRPLIWREVNLVDRLYRLSADELHNYKEEQFLLIFRKAFRNSSFYRNFYSNEGIKEYDIKTLDDALLLPVLTKDMVKQNSNSMLTVPRWRVIKASTSGTTGTPLSVFHNYRAIRLEQAYNWQRRKICGFSIGERLVSLRGHLGSSRLVAHASLINTMFLSSYLLSESRVNEYYSHIASFQAKAIEGYPSSLYSLALLFRDRGIRLKIPCCFTSSETLFPFQRLLIEDIFQTTIYDYYGCTERTVALSQIIPDSGYHEDPGYSICEYKNDHLITTSLINSSFPLIRYRVNDIVSRDENGRVIKISGRSEDIVICKDGTRLGRLDHIFKGVSGVDLAQIIQHATGEIDINVVLNSSNDYSALNEIMKNIRSRVHPNNLSINIRSAAKKDIIYTDRGKFSLVKSFL